MTHLLKRGMLALAMMAGLAFAAPAMAVDCTTSTTPNTAGTTANAQFEILQKLCSALLDPKSPGPLVYSVAVGSPFTLVPTWTKVVTNTSATRALLISDVTGSAYDIRWTMTTAGAAAPSEARVGQNVLAGETFPFGLPIGDVYLKSATGAQASVYVGNTAP